jgi:hypothetical protein
MLLKKHVVYCNTEILELKNKIINKFKLLFLCPFSNFIITSLYDSLLNRKPDDTGLCNYRREFMGLGINGIASSILCSDEYLNQNFHFVRILQKNKHEFASILLLEINKCIPLDYISIVDSIKLENIHSVRDLVANFLNTSNHYIDKISLITVLYQCFVGREPEEEELIFIAEKLCNKQDLARIIVEITNSTKITRHQNLIKINKF